MKVILADDVRGVGHRGDTVSVKPGFARNYLFPRGLAYEATEGNKKRIAAESRARTTRLQGERAGAEALAANLTGVTVTISAKAGEADRLFGSVTAQDIADALAAKGHPVDRRRLELEHPIKHLGEHTVPLRLHPDVHADLKVVVVPE